MLLRSVDGVKLPISHFSYKAKRMGFNVPQFPLLGNIYEGSTFPGAAPRVQNVQCNLAVGYRSNLADLIGEETAHPLLCMWLLCPRGTDLRGSAQAVAPDIVEVPMWSQRFYLVQDLDYSGSGFSNTHIACSIIKEGMWPLVMPDPNLIYPPPPPPPAPPTQVGFAQTGGVPALSVTFNITLAAPSRVVVAVSHYLNPLQPTCSLGAPIAGTPLNFTDGFGVLVGCYLVETAVLPAGVTPCTVAFPGGIGNLICGAYVVTPNTGITNQRNSQVMNPGNPNVGYGFSPVPLPSTGFGILSTSGGNANAAASAPWVWLADNAEIILGNFYRQELGYLLQTTPGTWPLQFPVPFIGAGCEAICSFA